MEVCINIGTVGFDAVLSTEIGYELVAETLGASLVDEMDAVKEVSPAKIVIEETDSSQEEADVPAIVFKTEPEVVDVDSPESVICEAPKLFSICENEA